MTHPPRTTATAPMARRRRRAIGALAFAAASLATTGVAAAHGLDRAGSGEHRTHRDHRGATGTVSAIADPTFTVTTRHGDVVITATADTTFVVTTDGTVVDAAVGSAVAVKGARSDDGTTVAARRIAVLPAPADPTAARHGHRGSGVVLTNDGSTLTVERKDGSVLTVTTTADTKVTVTAAGSFADLAEGARVRVKGVGDRTAVTATAVHVNLTTASVPVAPTADATATAAAASAAATPAAVSAPPAAAASPVAVAKTRDAADDGDDDHAARIGGEITAIDGSSFTLQLRDGSSITVTTTDTTTFTSDGGGVASLADLAVGDRVKVSGARADDGSFVAAAVAAGDCDADRDRGDRTDDDSGDRADGQRRGGSDRDGRSEDGRDGRRH